MEGTDGTVNGGGCRVDWTRGGHSYRHWWVVGIRKKWSVNEKLLSKLGDRPTDRRPSSLEWMKNLIKMVVPIFLAFSVASTTTKTQRRRGGGDAADDEDGALQNAKFICIK